MAKKIYAVRSGKKVGLFNTWEECKASVDGYSGAEFKGFTNIEDANHYLGITEFLQNNLNNSDSSNKTENSTPVVSTDKDTAIAYVDGSYNTATSVYSYGVVLFHNGNELHFSGSNDEVEMASMRNVAGEIEGSMAAMKYAIKNNIKSLTIYHDYEGIAKWPLGLWKTNKEGTIAYKAFYDGIKNKIAINFVKVKGHSGDKYNDLADRLAKEAAGIE